jgi:hypothetical protein
MSFINKYDIFRLFYKAVHAKCSDSTYSINVNNCYAKNDHIGTNYCISTRYFISKFLLKYPDDDKKLDIDKNVYYDIMIDICTECIQMFKDVMKKRFNRYRHNVDTIKGCHKDTKEERIMSMKEEKNNIMI